MTSALKTLQTFFTAFGASLPTATKWQRGQFAIKRAASTEDEIHAALADSSNAMQWRRIVTKTLADATYAPIGSKYIVQTADATLTNEQALGALATGIVKNTTTTGVLSIATAGTDYALPLTVQEEDVNVDTNVTTLDFDGSDFNVTSSPAGEANISLAYGTSAGTPAEGNHTHTATLDTNYQGATQETATAVINFTSWQHTVSGSGGTATIGERWLHPMQGALKEDLAIPAGTTFSGVGQTALTVAATASNVDTTDGPWVRSTTGSVSGNAAGFTGHSSGVVRYDWAPTLVFVIKTDSTATSIRVWVGCFASDPSGSADPAINAMGFRFDTGAGDTNWMAYINDGTSTGTATSTGIAYAASTVYRLGIHVDRATDNLYFMVNNASDPDSWTITNTITSGTANLPTSTATLTRYARVTTLTSAARHINLQRITHMHER